MLLGDTVERGCWRLSRLIRRPTAYIAPTKTCSASLGSLPGEEIASERKKVFTCELAQGLRQEIPGRVHFSQTSSKPLTRWSGSDKLWPGSRLGWRLGRLVNSASVSRRKTNVPEKSQQGQVEPRRSGAEMLSALPDEQIARSAESVEQMFSSLEF